MSYILDALKKIEQEKNRLTRSDGRVSISGDLFHERKQPVIRAGRWKVLSLVAAASLVTCAGTWFVLQGTGRKSAEIIRPAASPPAPANPPAVSPIILVPAKPALMPAPVTPAAPSETVLVVPKSSAAVGDDDVSARGVRRSTKQIKIQLPAPKPPVQTVQAPADIKLSGIAWQDERTARRAVINGFLLKEGAVVSGAKITDIQADMVRFSSSTGQFEIKLDAVLPAGVQR